MHFAEKRAFFNFCICSESKECNPAAFRRDGPLIRIPIFTRVWVVAVYFALQISPTLCIRIFKFVAEVGAATLLSFWPVAEFFPFDHDFDRFLANRLFAVSSCADDAGCAAVEREFRRIVVVESVLD